MQCSVLLTPGLTFIFHCLILDCLCCFPRVCVKVCDHVKGIFISRRSSWNHCKHFGYYSPIICWHFSSYCCKLFMLSLCICIIVMYCPNVKHFDIWFGLASACFFNADIWYLLVIWVGMAALCVSWNKHIIIPCVPGKPSLQRKLCSYHKGMKTCHNISICFLLAKNGQAVV